MKQVGEELIGLAEELLDAVRDALDELDDAVVAPVVLVGVPERVGSYTRNAFISVIRKLRCE